MKPTASIIIVNYNGKKFIDDCISSILLSVETFSDFEVIVVDNGSDDGSIPFLKNKYKLYLERIKFIELDKNYGPSKARNEGIRIASGNYIGFLDNDTAVDKNWLSASVRKFESDKKIGIIQCKLLLMDDHRKLDSIGEWIGKNGFLVNVVQNGTLDEERYNKEFKIFSAKSAGMFIRKDVLDMAGGFDDDYFIYMEETDLCWHSLMAGYENIFLPDSIVFHKFGTSAAILGKKKTGYILRFHGAKNYILTLFKNLNTANLILILPVHIFLWVGLAYFGLIYKRRIDYFVYIHKGILWNIANILKSIKKRKLIQKRRIVSDADIFKVLMKKRNLLFYINKVLSKKGVGNSSDYFR